MAKISGVKAVIFDMDGVLIDSEIVYRNMVGRFFEAHGAPLAEADLNVMAGASADASRRLFEEWWARTGNPACSGQEVEDRIYLESNFELNYRTIMFEGVPQTLRALAERGYRLALASSSSMENIQQVIDDCGIRDCFEFVVSGQDFTESKPDPAIYLHTLERLGLSAEECVVVEDSDYGITAAVRAGIPVIARVEDRLGYTQEGASYYIDVFPQLLDLL